MADGFAFGSELKGLTEVTGRLRNLRQGSRNKIVRPAMQKMVRIIAKSCKDQRNAMTAGIGPALRYLRKKVGTDYKVTEKEAVHLLAKAISSKVIVDSSGKVIGKVGVRKGFKAVAGKRTRDGKKSRKGDPIYYDPARIAHLVELGHGGPHPAGPHSFLRSGFDQAIDKAESVGVAEIRAGIDREAGKALQ